MPGAPGLASLGCGFSDCISRSNGGLPINQNRKRGNIDRQGSQKPLTVRALQYSTSSVKRAPAEMTWSQLLDLLSERLDPAEPSRHRPVPAVPPSQAHFTCTTATCRREHSGHADFGHPGP